MKYNAIKFLIPILFYISPDLWAQNKDAVLKFGVIADIQYADKDDHGTRFYRNSLQKLDACVDSLNKTVPDFNVVYGDLVDQGTRDLQPVIDRLHRLKSPVHNILGNHDYVGAADIQNLYKQFEMPASYYSFEKEGWVFIVLNTNELSGYGVETGSSIYKEWESTKEKLSASGRKNIYPWNGGISVQQLHWLEKQLINAEQEEKNILVFSHHPLYPENGLEALNNREILTLIQQHPRVRAIISGHHHEGDFAYYGAIPVITLEGMVETPRQNAFGIITPI
ncbi:metallophosphoesterase [Zhouia spongiae]|uniref:Metallophosphoesterase n=1 Tax=Zhouia spongiae TaxID=2202721 RepID=A0ABY3YMZ8_9FLAO|nr:metallophosphoesterase [Zhouia spongiae]UNY99013.1 metallophosphoesterase [Zhouia spongiae]